MGKKERLERITGLIKIMKASVVIFLAFCFVQCSPKLRSSIINAQPSLAEETEVVILPVDDNQDLSGIEVGTLKASDNGFSKECTYPQIIALLKEIARKNGANIIKLVKNKEPDSWSTCARVTGIAYRVNNPQQYQLEIDWSANRKLSWDDFKGKVPEKSYFDAESYCSIIYQTGLVTVFTKATFVVTNTFDCTRSWVRAGKKNDAILNHEQRHFDLCEIYTRKLKAEFDKQKIYINSGNKIDSIFSGLERQYNEAHRRYDEETQHGTSEIAQSGWDSYIDLELGF